ncbi:hypothetical protein [Nodosilinea sp. E11]|uniref:hypothetical protein n=1 Tax=Nodosilinea sp. E11 TaxID=3037479 RepID=UPI0029351246|nr:hypothetical protein [Nodosilinea sp. E11]WOD41704.1 hypothetical protein RRF56_12970 [Nodosilinea sp. E11]
MRKFLYLLMTSCISTLILSACANEISTEKQQTLQDDSSANKIPAEQNQSLQESNSVTELGQNSNNNLLFSCQTENDKLIKLYDFGDTIQYSFGPENNPEIVLDIPRDEASTYQWAGVGRSIYYSIDIPNANTVYTVFISEDRLLEGRPVAGGVDVLINNEYVTTVNCANEDIISNLMGVDLKPTN